MSFPNLPGTNPIKPISVPSPIVPGDGAPKLYRKPGRSGAKRRGVGTTKKMRDLDKELKLLKVRFDRIGTLPIGKPLDGTCDRCHTYGTVTMNAQGKLRCPVCSKVGIAVSLVLGGGK